jgi:hypothetical protein
MSEITIDYYVITQDDLSLEKWIQTPDVAQSSMNLEKLDINNNLSNADNDTNLHTIATATNLTHSFNPRSGTDAYYQCPYLDAFTRYNQSIPPFPPHPFSMALTHPSYTPKTK